MTVVVVPCLPVARPHLREAWRSLVGQGHPREAVGDDGVTALLWLGRALPAVLDVLAGLDLADVQLGAAVVDVMAPESVDLERGPLSLVAWRRDDELLVEVLILPSAALAAAAAAVVDAPATHSPHAAPTTGVTELRAGGVVWADAALVRLGFPFRIGALDLPAPGDVERDLEHDDTDNMTIDVRVRRFSLGRTET